MTTRRIVSSERTLLDKDEPLPPAQGIAGKGDMKPAVSLGVILKLLGFTLAMIIAPIGTYYGTINTIFKGTCGPDGRTTQNVTMAGASAALAANLVLVAYIIVAVKEDQSEHQVPVGKKETKKSL